MADYFLLPPPVLYNNLALKLSLEGVHFASSSPALLIVLNRICFINFYVNFKLWINAGRFQKSYFVRNIFHPVRYIIYSKWLNMHLARQNANLPQFPPISKQVIIIHRTVSYTRYSYLCIMYERLAFKLIPVCSEYLLP